MNSNIKNTQSQLKDVEKLLKLDPTNMELLSQKQKLLAQNIDSTSDKLETLKTANEQAVKSAGNYDAWKEKYDPIKSEITKTQEKLKDLKEQSKQADEQLAKGEISQEKYDKLQSKIKTTSDDLKALEQSAKDVSKEFGNPVSPQQYDALQREIIETENQLKNLQQEFENTQPSDTLQREIVETENELEKLQDEAEKSKTAIEKIGETGEKMQSVGDKISSTGSALMPITTAITDVSVAGTKSFAEVDKTMQLANKTMENTTGEAENLNEAMKTTASNSIFSMNDAATAVLNFARAGLDAESAADALAPAMNLAAGEGGDLDTVSAGLVGTLNSFHESFKKTGVYADVFAAACNNSALDVNSLSNSMSVAAPIFSAARYTVQDAALALGLMADANIEAEAGANSLKTGITRLNTPTKEGSAALSKMGFLTSDVAEQEAQLVKAQNLAEEKSTELTAKQLKYNEALEKYGEGSSQVASAQAALTKTENDLEQAQNAVNFLTQSAADGASEYAALMVDQDGKMRPFIDVLKDLQNGFAGLSESEQISAASAIFGKNQMTPWLALLNTAPDRVDKLSESINNSTGLTQEMADTMMGGFGGGIEKLKSSVDVLIYSIGESLAPTLQKAIDFIQNLIDKLNSLSPEMKETIVKIALIAAAIAPALIAIGKIISIIGTILTIIPKVANAIKLVKTAMMALNGTFLTNPIFLVIAAVTALVAGFIYLWNHCEGFRNFWIGLWEQIQITLYAFFEAWETGWNTISDFFSSIWESIKNFFSAAWNDFRESFQIGMDSIKRFWTDSWTKIKDFFANAWNGIKNFFTTVWNNFQEDFQIGMDSIKTFWTDSWTNIKNFFTNTWESIKTTVKNVMISIKNTISSIWNNVKSGISEKITGIKNTIVDGFNQAVGFVKNLANKAWTWGADIINGIVGGIRDCIGNVVNAVSDVANTIWEFLHFSVPERGALTDFESWMPDFMTGLADGIRKNQKYVENAVNDVSEAMRLTMDSDINYTLDGVSSGAMVAGTSSGTVNNYYTTDNSHTFNQTNNSPKSLSRFDIYRQTNNLLGKIRKG